LGVLVAARATVGDRKMDADQVEVEVVKAESKHLSRGFQVAALDMKPCDAAWD
jgi:hypothetical protein